MKNALESMKTVVANHPVIHHQFLEHFRNGALTKAQVVAWFEQQFYFSISLPSAFAALYARIPDRYWEAKRPLVELINVEAWGTDNSKAHSGYFIEVAKFLSIDLNALTAAAPKHYTQDYITARLNLCLNQNRPIVQGLAAIGLGNEVLNFYIFQFYKEGIHKIEGIEECPTGYFDAHLRDEESDFQIFQSLFDAVAQNEGDLKSAEDGLRELLDKRVIFFDRLSEDLGIV